MTQNALPQYDDLFPPSYNSLHLQVAVSITQTYTPPESFPLDPPPPYSIYSPITQPESDNSVFPQINLMIQTQIGISDPNPQPPLFLFKYLLKLRKKRFGWTDIKVRLSVQNIVTTPWSHISIEKEQPPLMSEYNFIF